MSLKPAPHVRFCALGDELVLLDLLRGKYLLLDSVAAAMWNSLLSGNAAVLAKGLSERFDAPISTIESDLKKFETSCLEAGLLINAKAELEPLQAKDRAPSRPVCLTGQALWTLIRTAFLLRTNLLAAYREGLRMAASIRLRPDEEVTDRSLDRALAAFVRAENLWGYKAAPDDCLPRSLALHCYLRRLGFPVTHRIGMTKAPLEMHAWVEFRSRRLLNDMIALKHTPLASIM
jgi:hypothetical protein